MKIGILGGGQLGRMLALAGYRLGLEFRFFDTTPGVCAEQTGELQVGDFGDEAALRRFADGLDALTFEWENVPGRGRKDAFGAAALRAADRGFACVAGPPRREDGVPAPGH